jgi:hypothetical protein
MAQHMEDDLKKDKDARKFIEALRKVGPFSKQILNYSYPPLLYQRGEEDDDESVDQGECDEDEEDEVMEDDILVDRQRDDDDEDGLDDDDYGNSQIDDGQLGDLPQFDDDDEIVGDFMLNQKSSEGDNNQEYSNRHNEML